VGWHHCFPHALKLLEDPLISNWRLVVRVFITVLLLLLSIIAARYLWLHFKVDPWTRDGRVRADTSQLAPDVSGLVTAVMVKDNQAVKMGDILFVIDRDRFALNEERAAAALSQIEPQLAQARIEYTRNGRLGDLVSSETREQSRVKVQRLEANLRHAKAQLAMARLDLERAQVRAPFDGVVTNLELLPGDYAKAGSPIFALISTSSVRVEGYFEETKLDKIHIGDPVEVTLMGDPRTVLGHVESIAGGIEDRDNASSQRLLANVNPTFNWVRLAQRVPVRVALDNVPSDMRLISGRTATVRVVHRMPQAVEVSQ
jgi:multidrug resistance efflux pump